MDSSEDYYAILGVLPSIDQVALTAVYRALMKKYHPDVFSGSREEAERISKQLNEAFSVLSDPERRTEYDNKRKASGTNAGDYERHSAGESTGHGTGDEALDRNWEVVVNYYPGAEYERRRLEMISKNLSVLFQIVLIDLKDAANYGFISACLEGDHLKRYFGANREIHSFVLDAIANGRKDVALEVNRAIRVLGTPSDIGYFIRRVRQKTNWPTDGERDAQKLLLAIRRIPRAYYFFSAALIIGFIIIITIF